LVPALIDDKDGAQSLHDIAFNAVENCRDGPVGRTAVFAGKIATLNATQQTDEDEFQSCKDGDTSLLQKKKDAPVTGGHPWTDDAGTHGGYGYNFTRTWNDEAKPDALGATSHESHAVEVHTRICAELDAHVASFNVRAQNNGEWCETPDPSDWSDAFRTNEDMVTNSHTWFSFMDNFEKHNAAEYKRLRKECHEARHRHQVRVEECHKLQSEFEAAYCAYANGIDEECHTYDTCYDSTYASFVIQNTSVADMEVQFKAQQHALECLLCYGDQILTDKTDLSACDGVDCVNCSPRLDIDYKIPHPEIPCDEEEPERPCTDGWCLAKYSGYADDGVPVRECQPCASPSYVDWTTR